MVYNIVINAGKKNMLEYISTTCLFPYFKDGNNVYFYFWQKDFNKDLDWKLDEIIKEIKILYKKDKQTFNLIYFISDYNMLLKEDVSERNSLFFYYNKIKIFSENNIDKEYTYLNHLLIFHSPWYTGDYKTEHDEVCKKIKEEIKNDENIKNNNIYIRNIKQPDDSIKSYDFRKINFKGIELILDVLEGNDWFANEDKEKYKDIIVNEFKYEEYKNRLSKYKSKLNRIVKKLKENETEINITIFKDNTEFWSAEQSGNNGNDKIEASLSSSVDFNNFDKKWEEFENKINKEVYEKINNIKSGSKVKIKLNSVNPSGDNEKTFKTEPTQTETTAEVIENKIAECEKIISDTEIIFKQITDENIKKEVKELLSNKKNKIRNIIKNIPFGKSEKYFYLFSFILTAVPFTALSYFAISGLINSAILLLSFCFILFILYLISFFIRKKAKEKLKTEIDSIVNEINLKIKDYETNFKNIQKNEIGNLNRIRVNKLNSKILYHELSKLRTKEKKKSFKEGLINKILENDDIRNIEEKKDNDYKHDKDSDFFTEIAFLIKDEIKDVIKTDN